MVPCVFSFFIIFQKGLQHFVSKQLKGKKRPAMFSVYKETECLQRSSLWVSKPWQSFSWSQEKNCHRVLYEISSVFLLDITNACKRSVCYWMIPDIQVITVCHCCWNGHFQMMREPKLSCLKLYPAIQWSRTGLCAFYFIKGKAASRIFIRLCLNQEVLSKTNLECC